MHLRDRFIIADPPGLDAQLVTAAQTHGAWALIDATHPGERGKLDDVDSDRAMLRVTLDAEPTPNVGLAMLAPWRIAPEHVTKLEDAIDAWNRQGTPTAVEVRTKEEARRAVDAGADMLVARGAEGPGRASERSNLVLLPALATFEVPLIAWGGAGPNATGALFVHADMVVLDAQLYLLEEAGLSDAWERSLRAFDGSDVKALGSTLGEPFHVHARVADEHVHKAWESEHASQAGPATRREELFALLDAKKTSFDQDPGAGFVPLGHDAAHASFFEEHGTLKAALAFLETRIEDQLDAFALSEGSPLARAHATRYPIVQGAMANVSEVPAFAKAVADEGALPFLAFAALREEWAREALEGTLEELEEDQPFGCGIIGLDVNATKRDAHIRLLKEHEPPYALIAAGTAEQALHLENEGIDTYLHTPSRGIVRQALDMGLERIVVEGNECGGHIGKLPSLVLWDQALQEVQESGTDAMVLLAGGIGDEATSAMAGTLASASSARVGALMGTAYLATREIVETGAIPDSYQDVVLAAKDTDVTGSTTGIRSRSAPTPFTKRISTYEQDLLKEGVPLDERQEKVERKNLGSTRLAARRLKRDEDGDYHKVSISEQLTDGNFLMGQGAELIEDRITIQDLHESITSSAEHVQENARERLMDPFLLPTPEASTFEIQDGAIAIVGLGCVMPDADDVDTFWDNLMRGHVSIRELPEGRWPVPKSAHYDPDGEEGTYTLLGAFIEDTSFDAIEYRIPPAVADQMDPGQKWAVKATEQALQDAGLDAIEDRDRWSVILGNAQGGEARNWSDRRVALRETIAGLEREGVDEDVLERMRAMMDDYKPITEDTMPGELSNVIASRVCHVFDIGGPARTVDTACASSLAAAEEAVRQLRDGDVDVAITGGVDRSMHPAAYTKFSAIGALSREGSFPFDERASGFVMGEGCGILVLKRLEDAIQDGDQVYAVIEGVGSSSDGSGKGITAPNPEGQERAMQRAWDDAGTDPGTLAFIEAHGTGTPVGDPTEAKTLDGLIREHAEGPVALGSVKANIGHLKSAAGAAGLLKAALALHHGRVPPTPVETPTPHIDWDDSPLKVATDPVGLGPGTLRAGVSAFGFGGTNSHLVLASPPTPQAQASKRAQAPFSLVSADDIEAMEEALATPREAWTFSNDDALRVAVGPDADQADAEKLLNGELPPGLALRKGIAVAMGEQGQLGLVFPGQGSQYPGMVLDLADEHPAARDVLEEADQILAPLLGQPLSRFLELEGEEGEEALTPTEVCQPAVLTCDIAILRVLEEHGVEPDVVAGHSLGEYAALVAAGALSFEDALMAVSARGEEMKDVAEKHVDDPGGLIAVRAGPERCEELMEGLEAWPANLNGPEQTVLAGTTSAIDTIKQRANEADIKSKKLPVSAAFHSPIVAPATEPLRKTLERIPIDPPQIPVIANATAEPYPSDPEAIRDLLAKQVKSPVRWAETMDRFDAMGVDLVVESGPKPVLTGLARENLPDTMSVPTAFPREGAKETLEVALLALAAHGHLHLPTRDTPEAKVQREPTTTTVTGPDTNHPSATSPPGRSKQTPRVVVSGVSLGLPSPDPAEDAFSEHAKNALLTGENRIARVSDDERHAMANMGVTRLVKDEEQGPHLMDIDDPDDVVHLVGRLPELDLAAYGADEDWLENADPTSRFGIAAALEALTDAKIPLVPNTRETSTGTTLTSGWVLPEPLQEGTGVILASAFPGYANLVRILNDQPDTARLDAGQDRLTSFLADLIPRIDDPGLRKTALDLLIGHAPTDEAPPMPNPARENGGATTPSSKDATNGDQPFPRDFLFQALGMGHAQIAQLVNAKGPNLHVNAACASTTSALALAQDWIQQGRCERVIVVGADVGGDPSLLPLIGSGFLAAGAATTSKHVDEAALPFDERRHGMLVGSGAVGLVVETQEAAEDRGITPLAELVHAHTANSAYHGARLDPDHVKHELDKAIDHAADTLDAPRSALAKDLVFVSHEPATPARGGSAEAEVRALRHAFGDAAEDVLITNTKGLTGHAMGAGIEDAIAVELLRARQAPPVANLKNVDPAFTDLTFSQGEPTDRSLSVRFAAGFGSQVAIAFFHRIHDAPGSLDEATNKEWLARTIGQGTTTRIEDRCLRAAPKQATPAPSADQPARQAQAATATTGTQATAAVTTEEPDEAEPTDADDTASRERPTGDLALEDVEALLTELVSKKTGYPEDVIEPEMDLEADLGVDTVKQAEVVSLARTRLEIPPIEGLSLGDVPTLRQASKLLHEHATGEPASPTQDAKDDAPAEPATSQTPARTGGREGDQGPTGDLTLEDVEALLTELASKKTGYPEDVIEPEMDLEADLGVDTVKQAEILSQARTRLEIPPIEGLSLGDVPTLRQASKLLHEHATGQTSNPESDDEARQDEPDQAQDEKMRVLNVTTAPAPPLDPLPEDTRVKPTGDTDDAFTQALEAHGAILTNDADKADLIAMNLPTLSPDPDDLTSLLERLQGIPQGTRIVLLAPHGAPTAGLPALAGTLTQEGWPTRAIRTHPKTPPERVAKETLQDATTSILLTPHERRTRALAPTGQPAPVELPNDAVVLAPGGLGAAVLPCLERLAEEQGVRLAIAGRSPVQDQDPTLDPEDDDDIARLREELLDEARASDEALRPAEIEEEVQRRVKLARRAKAYRRLAKTTKVRYDQVDATDPESLEAWVDDVARSWEAPRLVVHGAGVDDSRGFQKKTRDTMHAVLDVKLTPVATLTDKLPQAHHVAFGSIAGVAGNPGQADYALANGTLEALLDPVDGTILHWTAWDAAGGMADDDTIRTMLEERDVAFLDPDEGARLFMNWAGTRGVFAVANLRPDSGLVVTHEGAILALDGEEPWLRDHEVQGRLLLPGVRHLEAMAEAYRGNGEQVEGFSRVRFERPLWVNEPTRVKVETEGGEARTVRDERVHARARLGVGAGGKPVRWKGLEGDALTQEEVYEALFHGPSFQVLERLVTDDGRAEAIADVGAGGAASWLLGLEAGMQAAGIAAGDEVALPVGVERLERGVDPVEGRARVACRLVGEDLAGSTWDVTVRDAGGDVVVHAEGVRLQRANALAGMTDAIVGLGEVADVTVKAVSVPVHDPRDPSAKREAEHEAGQEAAHRALEESHGEAVSLSYSEEGQPLVDEGAVSISHAEGFALAAADPGVSALGVDLERVVAREEAWLEDAFSGEERAWIRDHAWGVDAAATLAWTLKEAASKALGTGLGEPLDAFEVSLGEGSARVSTPGGVFVARWARAGEGIVALAWPEDAGGS